MKTHATLLCLSAAMLTSGCATIVTGSSQDAHHVHMRPVASQAPNERVAPPAAALEALLIERHSDLIADIATGSGETLQAFYVAANISYGQEEETVRTLGLVHRLTAGPDEFRRVVIADFAASPATTGPAVPSTRVHHANDDELAKPQSADASR